MPFGQLTVTSCPGFNRIDRILRPTSCTFFYRSSSAKNIHVKRAWDEAIRGWMTDMKSFRVHTSEDKVRKKDKCWPELTVYIS
jgi:hypothetical protein